MNALYRPLLKSFCTAGRTLRRVLIAIAFAIPLLVFGTGRYESAAFSVWHFLLGVSLVIFIWLVGFYGHSIGLVDGRFDERQRELNQKATSLVYPILIAPIIISMLLYQSGQAQTPVFEFFFFATFYLVGFLPASIVAWLEPNPPAEEVSRASNA